VAIFGVQPYFTTGAGLYRETLGTHQDTSFGFNTGGGVKITLIGPLRLRVDYRVFKLGSDALYSPAHRIYVGLNLKL
jgi:opacity protein-like surface antigen